MDIGTAKPTAAEQAEVRHHLLDLVDPDDDYTVARFQRRLPRRAGRHRGPGRPGPARRRHRPVPAGGGRRPRHPRSVPRGPSRARGRARRRRPHRHAPAARSRRRRPHGAGQPASGGAGPRGDPRQRPAVLVLRPRARGLPARAVPARRSRHRADRCSTSGSRRATTTSWKPGSSPRCGACSPVRGACPAPPDRPWATPSCSTTSSTATPLPEAVATAVRRTRRFARRQQRWFGRDPRITWIPGPGASGPGGDNAVAETVRALVD